MDQLTTTKFKKNVLYKYEQPVCYRVKVIKINVNISYITHDDCIEITISVTINF